MAVKQLIWDCSITACTLKIAKSIEAAARHICSQFRQMVRDDGRPSDRSIFDFQVNTTDWLLRLEPYAKTCAERPHRIYTKTRF